MRDLRREMECQNAHLEELVVVDEEPDFPRALLGRDVEEGGAVVAAGQVTAIIKHGNQTLFSQKRFEKLLKQRRWKIPK